MVGERVIADIVVEVLVGCVCLCVFFVCGFLSLLCFFRPDVIWFRFRLYSILLEALAQFVLPAVRCSRVSQCVLKLMISSSYFLLLLKQNGNSIALPIQYLGSGTGTCSATIMSDVTERCLPLYAGWQIQGTYNLFTDRTITEFSTEDSSRLNAEQTNITSM